MYRESQQTCGKKTLYKDLEKGLLEYELAGEFLADIKK